ncbi:PAS domain-containing protein [Azohydromonas australica]|uniref:PAS domain-containing protein n=1 Tax=Azohydromonas australica TaxID=364039 RepID=UPI000686A273|nr:PAS domain-containing protein [Azohydromonas australica]
MDTGKPRNEGALWPCAQGEMAQRLRQHDWAATALGAIGQWPVSLRTVIDLMLCDTGMVALAWGKQARLFCNDAFGHRIGPRSVQALGRCVFETFASAREVFEPHLLAAQSGQTVQLHDQVFPFLSPDASPQAWFDVTWLPVHGEEGEVAGVLVRVTESTARVHAEQRRLEMEAILHRSELRQSFLLRLSDKLRPLSDPLAVLAEALRVLGKHLGAMRVLYSEVSPDSTDLTVQSSYTAPGACAVTESLQLPESGPSFVDALAAGREVVVDDIALAADLSSGERHACAALGIAALVGMPLVKQGRFVATLSVHHAKPHAWTPNELAMIEEAAERTWAAVEHARAQAALRESEARIRAIANLVPDLLWRSDAQGEVQWYSERWFEYTGQDLLAALGQGWRDVVHPQDLPQTSQNWREASLTGNPYVSEHRLRRHDGEYRWFLTRAEPSRDQGGSVTLWFGSATDIHEQRAARDVLDRRVKERTRELERASELRRQLLAHVETLQDEERRRIARELHDSLGQFLSAMLLSVASVQRQLKDGAAAQQFIKLQRLLEQVDHELDRIVFTLRPTALEDEGLGEAVKSYVSTWSELCDRPVDLLVAGLDERRLPLHVEAAVFRVIQEALNNVAKHAGARSVSVSVECLGRQLVASVEDDGIGFDPEQAEHLEGSQPSWGLLGMRERVEALGGTFAIESRVGQGTAILLRVPLP